MKQRAETVCLGERTCGGVGQTSVCGRPASLLWSSSRACLRIRIDLTSVCCRLLQLQRSVLSPDSDVPDELLYGRAGYLYALLYVKKELGTAAVDEGTVTKVCSHGVINAL